MAKTISDTVAGELARALLGGTGLAAFTFSTQFTLSFDRGKAGSLAGSSLPIQVDLVLHCYWFIGDEAEWLERVNGLGDSAGVEPDEPLSAFELAKLRWTPGSCIEAVQVQGVELMLVFENGTKITARPSPDDEGPSWLLYAPNGGNEGADRWSLMVEGGRLFLDAPVDLGE